MWLKTLLYLSLVSIFYGCRVQRMETARLKHKADSLKTELEARRSMTGALQEAGSLQEAEIDTLQKRVKNYLAESAMIEAEAYYAWAQAVEQTANRTRFAPGKKRETRLVAVSLYKMAAIYGKDEAIDKVANLERKTGLIVAIDTEALSPINFQKK